jgi:hypothetical protein
VYGRRRRARDPQYRGAEFDLRVSHGLTPRDFQRTVAEYFGKVGRKVRSQKLGEDFQDQTFRVQVLDEGEYEDRDWKADLKKMLDGTPWKRPRLDSHPSRR